MCLAKYESGRLWLLLRREHRSPYSARVLLSVYVNAEGQLAVGGTVPSCRYDVVCGSVPAARHAHAMSKPSCNKPTTQGTSLVRHSRYRQSSRIHISSKASSLGYMHGL